MESLTCALCFEIYTSPKLLPCFHTYCKECLEQLSAQYPKGTFPCPSCRKETTVPPGGVSAFQTNFYIDSNDLKRARDSKNCKIHSKLELTFFCIRCDQAICLNCKLTKHEIHETTDLTEVAATAKTQLLLWDKSRIGDYISDVTRSIEVGEKEQQAVKDKKSALKLDIHNRHATLQAVIDRYRDEALASLNTVANEILSAQHKDVVSKKDNLYTLTQLQREVQHALDNDNPAELVNVAREMRSGRGNEKALQKLTTKHMHMKTVRRPVLRFTFNGTPDTLLQLMHDYMGSAVDMELAASEPEVTVVEQFRCREDPDTDVCHVCPLSDDRVWVSYEPYMARKNPSSEKFGIDGKVVSTYYSDIPLRVTMVRRKDGNMIYPNPKPGLVSIFAKRCNSRLTTFFILDNDNTPMGQATVRTASIQTEKPLTVNEMKVFAVNCSTHRSFDVDGNEQLFVVLEEGKTPDFQRRVQLYRRPQPDAIATYIPPVAPCQPSDVCFYTLGGQEVLLVADELNDAIHVVNVQDGLLSFARYLSPGCPLLVQPTALNTDMKGRLWVACRGGKILTCTPVDDSTLKIIHDHY